MSWKSEIEATVNGRDWSATLRPRVGLVSKVDDAEYRITILEEQIARMHSYLGVKVVYKGTHLQKITEETE
jgi:hypothetical protein